MTLLKIKNIHKVFPGCIANDNIDFEMSAGEIHALLGENGAGKSTLVKIIYGLLSPDKGQIFLNGAETKIASPLKARELGIGMVFQHFSLFDALTVLENISINLPKSFKKQNLDKEISEISRTYGLSVDPNRQISSLSVGERQRVEIIRCLLQKPKLIILDEPTSVLTPQESEKLFEILRKLAKTGCGILYISHRLREIMALCSRATILRMGKVVKRCDPSVETAQSLAEMMMGTNFKRAKRNFTLKSSSVRLQVKGLSKKSRDPHGVSLKHVSFEVKGGEIFGIAGLAGNGQSELMAQLSGEASCENPEDIFLEGTPIGTLGPSERRAKGLSYIPEERIGHGAVPDLALWENGFLSAMHRKNLIKSGFVRVQKSKEFARSVIQRFKVKVRNIEDNASSLSGGNLQKFIVGRELEQSPTTLIALQPTWGVDAGSATVIHDQFIRLAESGAAVLIISQDLDELFLICDTIAVIFEGRLSQRLNTQEADVSQIGLLMGGIDREQSNQKAFD